MTTARIRVIKAHATRRVTTVLQAEAEKTAEITIRKMLTLRRVTAITIEIKNRPLQNRTAGRSRKYHHPAQTELKRLAALSASL